MAVNDKPANHQLTLEIAHVLFMDIVEYSLLPMSAQGEAIFALQEIVKGSRSFQIAQSRNDLISLPTGDGMALVFFGDPSVPVDCARSVSTALKEHALVRVRMGIHSGPVYRVPDINANMNVAGGGINLAQRVMNIGGAGHILISKGCVDMLLQLDAKWHTALEDLGIVSVKHGESIHVFNFSGDDFGNQTPPERLRETTNPPPAANPPQQAPVPAATRPSPAPDTGRGGLVGRREELAIMQAAAAQPGGSVILISGEAGIGKTAVVEAFLQSRAGLVGTGRSAEHAGGIEAFLPVLELISELAEDGRAHQALMETAPAWFVQLEPHSISLPGIGPVMDAARTPTPQRLKRELLAFMRRLCAYGPVTLFFEDIHWSDPSTVDMFTFLASRCPDLPLLILATFRPGEFEDQQSLFRSAKLDLQARGIAREIALPFLSADDVGDYLRHTFAREAVSAAAIRSIHRKTEGNPLFMINLIRDLRSQQQLYDDGERVALAYGGPVDHQAVPQSIESLIDRNLARLHSTTRELMEAAAIFGADFNSALVGSLLGRTAESVEVALAEGETGHCLVREVRDGTLPNGQPTRYYAFTHALYRTALIRSLVPSTLRRLSGAAANLLISTNPDSANAIAAQTASLLSAAGDHERASAFYLKAASYSTQVSAHEESISLAQLGLSAAERLPASQRTKLELDALLVLGKECQTARGLGSQEGQDYYARAFELSKREGVENGILKSRTGLLAFYLIRAQFSKASVEADELIRLAEIAGNRALLAATYFALATIRGEMADYESSIRMHKETLRVQNEQIAPPAETALPINPTVGSPGKLAVTLWMIGKADEALVLAKDALRRARELKDPYGIAFALNQLAIIYVERREARSALETAEAALSVADEHGFMDVVGWGQVVKGWVLTNIGQSARGILLMRASLQKQRECGFEFARPFFLNCLIEGLLGADDLIGARETAAESIAVTVETGAVCYLAESHRLHAVAQAKSGNTDEAWTELNEGFELAHRQGAPAWELRSALSMVELFSHSDRRVRAMQLLRSVLSRVGEGFDTPDVKRAEELVAEESGNSERLFSAGR